MKSIQAQSILLSTPVLEMIPYTLAIMLSLSTVVLEMINSICIMAAAMLLQAATELIHTF
ncbi:hypothetical protein [Selenomonas ruminantium]|uniref:hypothetical protein n=1 Tax=Selenomonas ruminantium TaxID=971 RepID=UPI00094CCCC0|nr:hypothetical protein [Selenomonas ruminantium]